MSRKNIETLIIKHDHRLQKLKEQQASLGLDTPPHISTEIENIEAAIEELQVELEALEDRGVNEESLRVPSELAEDIKSKQRVQIYISGDFSSVSTDRRLAAIDAFAAVLGISPQFIEIYKVERVLLERHSGETEEWIIKEGRFHLVTSARPTRSSGTHGKSQRAVEFFDQDSVQNTNQERLINA